MNAYTFLMYFNLFWRARSDPWRAFQVFRMRKSSSWTLLARVYVVVYGHGALEESLSSSCSNCERQTKYSCITCGKSVCVRSECSIPEVNEEAIGWQPNKRVGYCLKCALCTEKLVKDCQSEVDDKDHGQRDLTTCIREEEEEESDSWKTNTCPDEAILCIYDGQQYYLIKVLKVMILFIGFQTARRALDGDVAPIYSTPTAGNCQNVVISTIFSIIFPLVIGKCACTEGFHRFLMIASFDFAL